MRRDGFSGLLSGNSRRQRKAAPGAFAEPLGSRSTSTRFAQAQAHLAKPFPKSP
jgi:hypothetical protein